ncbi:hypothetical protein OKW50_008131 [Paraburkholderia youngii]
MANALCIVIEPVEGSRKIVQPIAFSRISSVFGTVRQVSEMNQNQYGQDHKEQPGEDLWQALVVSCKPQKPVQLAEAALHYPAPWQQNKGFLRLCQLDYLKLDSLIKRCLHGLLTGMSQIGERHLDRLAHRLLNLTRQFPDLRELLFVGRRHMQSEQLSQCINCHLNFAAWFALLTVVTCARSTLAGRLQRAPVENDSAGIGVTSARLGVNR